MPATLTDWNLASTGNPAFPNQDPVALSQPTPQWRSCTRVQRLPCLCDVVNLTIPRFDVDVDSLSEGESKSSARVSSL